MIRTGQTNTDENLKCVHLLATDTFHGDSGSAVLTDIGLVDGIAINGSEYPPDQSRMGVTWILPLSCARDRVLGSVPDDDDTKILKFLSAGDQNTLQDNFKPLPPFEQPDWLSNLRVAKALSDTIANWRSKGQPPPIAIAQNALPIISERRLLDHDLYGEFVSACARIPLAAAKVFQRFGDAREKAGVSQDAKDAYKQAAKFYHTFIADELPPDQLTIQPGSSPAIAGAYKAAADNQTKLAQITGDKSDYERAAQLAAAAAFSAPEGPLKTSSFTALGSALHGAGDTAAAVSAFQQAELEGPVPGWAKSSLSLLKAFARQPSAN